MFAVKQSMAILTNSRFYLYISIALFLVLPICCADARTPLEIPLEEAKEGQDSGEMTKNSDACTQKNVALQAVNFEIFLIKADRKSVV